MNEQEKKELPREHAIIERIAKVRGAVAELEHRINTMKAELHIKKIELSNFEEAARMFYGDADYEMMMGSLRMNPALVQGVMFGDDNQLKTSFILRSEGTAIARKRRTLSKNWATILRALSGMETFGYEQIMKLEALHDLRISIQSARTQMSAYIDAGLVKRVEEGQFLVTEDGTAAALEALARYALRESNDDPKGAFE